MKRKALSALAGTIAVAVVLSIGACAKAVEPFKDAPRSKVDNGAPADLIRMPDGVSNIFTKCDGHGNRLFVAYHGNSPYAAIAVAAQDPTCPRS